MLWILGSFNRQSTLAINKQTKLLKITKQFQIARFGGLKHVFSLTTGMAVASVECFQGKSAFNKQIDFFTSSFAKKPNANPVIFYFEIH